MGGVNWNKEVLVSVREGMESTAQFIHSIYMNMQVGGSSLIFCHQNRQQDY